MFDIRYILPLTTYPYSGVAELCNLCDDGEYQVISTWDRDLKKLNSVACVSCGLIRTNPMPTDNELESYYGNTYRQLQFSRKYAPSAAHLARSWGEARRRVDLLT